VLLLGAIACLSPAALVASPYDNKDREKQLAEEERQDPYLKWLNEDVVYIISDEERAVFQKLTTTEEKEKFVEEFWKLRDPDPGDSFNEFKEEHYRRLAYANENFRYGGRPGWMTDRGMIYIKFGPPENVERHAAGSYNREPYEGGGQTLTYPFERWWYRHLGATDSEVEIEFVDPTRSGEFRLALDPDEKDALLFTPLGQTQAEKSGQLTRADRILLRDRTSGYALHRRAQDMPFERLFRMAALTGPVKLPKKELQELVDAKISYHQLPFSFRTDYMKLDAETGLVSVTVRVPNKELQFRQSGEIQRARVVIYTAVTGLNGRTAGEAEESVVSEYPVSHFAEGVRDDSYYHKFFFLPPGLYKLTVVAKDTESGKVGTAESGFKIDTSPKDRIEASSLVLSSSFAPLQRVPQQLEPFVWGDLKLIPAVGNRFEPHDPLGVYLQLYNVSLDESSLRPDLVVRYEILKEGQLFFEFEDSKGSSIRYASPTRIELLRGFPLSRFPVGRYEIRVSATDRIGGSTITAKSGFEVVSPPVVAASVTKR